MCQYVNIEGRAELGSLVAQYILNSGFGFGTMAVDIGALLLLVLKLLDLMA